MSAFDYSEIHKFLKKINGWEVKQNEQKSYYLEKSFKFKNFLKSQSFVNLVGNIAEEEAHHPDISLGWGYSVIMLHTHAIKGLSINDFVIALKIDELNN